MKRAGAVLALFAALVLGCDRGTPVAPQGATLSVFASPQEIAVNGTSVITVIATRSNGIPVNPGTEIQLSSTLGAIDSLVMTDDAGVASAVLRATDRSGTATVTATSGAAGSVTTDVTIGFRASAVSLLPTPTSVSENGGSVSLLAIVRDDQGQPLRDAGVNFLTELGTLDSGGSLVQTNDLGEAIDKLVVTQLDADLDPFQESFRAFAEVGCGGATVTTETIIRIRRAPRAAFTFRPVLLTVEFTDTSTGAPIQWQWDFGDGATSQAQNPVHTYAAAGTYTVTLTASNAEGQDVRQLLVTVTGGT